MNLIGEAGDIEVAVKHLPGGPETVSPERPGVRQRGCV